MSWRKYMTHANLNRDSSPLPREAVLSLHWGTENPGISGTPDFLRLRMACNAANPLNPATRLVTVGQKAAETAPRSSARGWMRGAGRQSQQLADSRYELA